MTPAATHGRAGKRLLRQGREWVVLLLSGGATVADLAALACWRRQSPAHEAAFAQAVRLQARWSQAYRSCPEAFVLPARAPVLGRRLMLGGAMAAAAAGYLVVRPPLQLWPDLAELQASDRTGIGEQRHLALSEGVMMHLNTRTSIARDATTAGCQVKLIAGEAGITARLEGPGLLTVLASSGHIWAQQARFNIRYDDAGVCVTCVDGRVSVEHRGQRVTLAARQQVSYDERGLLPPVEVDPVVVTAWQSGQLVFRDTRISDVIREINRYRRGPIILANGALGRRTVDGVFHLDRIDGVIEQLRKLGATVRFLPAGVVLIS